MIKQISFFKRKEGISVEDFQDHWRSKHAELVVKLPNLRGYVQNHTLSSGYAKHEPDFDGVAEVWFESTDDMRSNVGSDILQAIRDDEHNFIDRSSMGMLLTEEVVIVDGPRPPGAVKSIAFLNKRDDVTPEFFQQHWRTQHANIASQIAEQLRYVQCHCRLGIYATGRKPPFDGVPMSWFASFDDLKASGNSEAFRLTRADEPNFMVTGRLPFSVAEEVEIVAL